MISVSPMTDTLKIVPHTIGIIMDGNRRWAKERGLPTLEGHRAGYEKLKDVCRWAREAGVRELIVYAFSTENWNRTQEEVSYLMDLLEHALREMTDEAKREHMRLIVLGDRARLSPALCAAIADAEGSTKHGAFRFGVALSYGGRTEIIDAIHRIAPERLGAITEEEFSTLLWTRDFQDPDLILRTSGEQRVSNFLPWQSVYSELVFTPTYWPAFEKAEFDAILAEYAARDRRKGK